MSSRIYGWAYSNLRDEYWATLEQLGFTHVPCALCKELVDLQLKGRSSKSRSIDHQLPVSKGGDLMDWRSWQVVHYGCNAVKGNRNIKRDALAIPEPSREW